MNKALIYLAAAPLVLAPIGVGAASAQEVTSESSSLDVAGVLGVSETEASTEGDGSASAGTVTLGGNPLIDGATGGAQEGEGQTSGALLDTGDTDLGSLSVGEYDARVVEGDGGTTSESSATLLSTTIGDEDTVTVDVLASESEADSTGGSSSTDGVVLNVGGGELEVVLLHSESSTDGDGGAFLASVNGEQIVSTEQTDGCAVDADPLVEVICFTAEEGETTIESEAAVADVEVIEDTLFVTLAGTSAGGAEEEPTEESAEGTSAESAVLQLQDILTLSGTEAESGEASAEVLTLGETTIIGGTQEGDGTEAGSLVDTGETELGSVAVAPYEATVDGESSSAETSLLEATLIDGETLSVEVLHSESAAGPDGSESSTQGVVVDLGGGELEVVILDSTANGDGEGSASVATVNGEPVVSSEQADGCVLDADPLVQVACVTATEGQTTIETEAAVAEAELVEDQLVLTLVGAGAQSDSAAPVQSEAAGQSGSNEGSGGNDDGNGNGNDDGGNGDIAQARALPLTGGELTLLGLFGAAALAAGAGVLVASGRRSDDATA